MLLEGRWPGRPRRPARRCVFEVAARIGPLSATGCLILRFGESENRHPMRRQIGRFCGPGDREIGSPGDAVSHREADMLVGVPRLIGPAHREVFFRRIGAPPQRSWWFREVLVECNPSVEKRSGRPISSSNSGAGVLRSVGGSSTFTSSICHPAGSASGSIATPKRPRGRSFGFAPSTA